MKAPAARICIFCRTGTWCCGNGPRCTVSTPRPNRRNGTWGGASAFRAAGLAGRVVFSLEDIEAWRGREPDTPLILVRGDTVPDDIREISAADGLLTARGGSTSHAAIVAHRLNKTCIVGLSEMVCRQAEKTATIGHARLAAGDWVSIDGLDGAVYHGRLESSLHVKERGTV